MTTRGSAVVALSFPDPSLTAPAFAVLTAAIILVVLEALLLVALLVMWRRRRDAERRRRAILQANPDTMFLLTRDGVYLDYHAGDASLLPASPSGFLGRHLRDVLPAHVATAYSDGLARVTSEPLPVVMEYAVAAAEGEHQHEARMVPGRRDEVLVIVRDVTERHRSAREWHERQSDIARVSRLAALGEFAASIAHEIRQPLTGILINTKTCLRWLGGPSPDLAEVRAALSDVVEAVQRANDIIRRNRELFRHHAAEKSPLDLAGIVRDVEALARPRLQAGRITMVTALTADAPPVLGDRNEIQQVLLNLIGNSIDAMNGIDRESRRIEVSSSFMPDGHVKVSVRDTGVGLGAVDKTRMFALSYTTKAAATGVGLSISRSIVEAHGGELWADEHDGGGATFSFTLPVHSAVSTT